MLEGFSFGTFAPSAGQGVGQILSGYQQYQYGKYLSGIYNRNAEVSAYAAEDALLQGEQDVLAYQTQLAQTIGAGRADFGASGVAVDEGSALRWQENAALVGDLDVARIRLNSEREAYKLRTEEWNQRVQAQSARYQGKQQLIGGIVGGVTSILGGVFGGG